MKPLEMVVNIVKRNRDLPITPKTKAIVEALPSTKTNPFPVRVKVKGENGPWRVLGYLTHRGGQARRIHGLLTRGVEVHARISEEGFYLWWTGAR